jgi:hypothetical protein
MYCPNCGNKNDVDQNFCRTCGLGLEKIAQSLTEQLPSVPVRSLQERKERLERLGLASLSVFGVGVAGFLLYSVFIKLMLTEGTLVAVLAVLGTIILLGAGLASVILFAKAKDLNEATRRRKIATGEPTGKLLESHQKPAFSISDQTTNLLGVDVENNPAE